MAGATFFKAVLTVTVVLLGCAELEMEADRIPTELTVSPPDSSRFTVGEPAKLEFVVEDQHGEVMPVPSWAQATWRATPGSVAYVSGDGTLTGKEGGWVRVTARLAGMVRGFTYCVNPARVALSAPLIYLNQATQNRDGSVSLIAGRPALLRVFAVADQVNCLESPVRVTLTRGNEVVFEQLVPAVAGRIPTSIDESTLTGSYNLDIPGSAIQPGVEMVVELDPEEGGVTCPGKPDPVSARGRDGARRGGAARVPHHPGPDHLSPCARLGGLRLGGRSEPGERTDAHGQNHSPGGRYGGRGSRDLHHQPRPCETSATGGRGATGWESCTSRRGGAGTTTGS